MKYSLSLVVCLLYGMTYGQDYGLLKKQLESVYFSDQQCRTQLDSLVRKEHMEWNSPAVQRLLPLMARQDSVNLVIVSCILNRYGWPGVEQVGERANEALFLVIQHATHDTICRYFPLLLQSCETGGTPRRFYAMMLDRLLVEKGRPQLFGTQISPDVKDGKYVPFPITDEVNVDTRRTAVGLADMRTWLREFNR